MNISAQKKLKSPTLSNHSGQSIVEVVLSIGVAALVIGALIVLGTVSLRTALSSARRTEGTRIAVSGLEAMRYLRDTQGFSQFVTDSNNGKSCYQIAINGQISTMSGADGSCVQEKDGWQTIDLTNSASKSIYKRRIKVVAYGDPNNGEQTKMRKVIVTVRWPEGTGETVGGEANQKSVEMSVVLSSW